MVQPPSWTCLQPSETLSEAWHANSRPAEPSCRPATGVPLRALGACMPSFQGHCAAGAGCWCSHAAGLRQLCPCQPPARVNQASRDTCLQPGPGACCWRSHPAGLRWTGVPLLPGPGWGSVQPGLSCLQSCPLSCPSSAAAPWLAGLGVVSARQMSSCGKSLIQMLQTNLRLRLPQSQPPK